MVRLSPTHCTLSLSHLCVYVFARLLLTYIVHTVKGVPGFGAKTAATLIKEFGTIEQLLVNVNKVEPVGKRERYLRRPTHTHTHTVGAANLPLQIEGLRGVDRLRSQAPQVAPRA